MNDHRQVQDDSQIQAEVYMLPPSFAIYLPGAIVVPIVVRPALPPTEQNPKPKPKVYVPPLLFAHGITRIQWCLVLLSEEFSHRIEFSREPPPIVFTEDGVVRPIIVSWQDMGTTQVALKVATPNSVSAALDSYDINFDLHQGLEGYGSPLRVQAKVQADPAVSVTPEPVDIPTWP
jgi:hypothetical protein